MTISVTTYVPEGIVMASDSRLIGTINYDNGLRDRFVVTDNAQKIGLVRNNTIGVSYCGSSFIDNKPFLTFLKDFDKKHIIQSDSVDVVAEKLYKYIMKYDQVDINFYLAGYDDNDQKIYKIQKKGLRQLNEPINGKERYSFECDGHTYVIKAMLEGKDFDTINFDMMQLADAIEFAEFLVYITSTYERFVSRVGACGGSTDILLITNDYTKFIKHKILNP